MKLLLDLLQAAGASAATGVRPFLPTLVYGALARADLGVDFDGTAFAFLESIWFLVLLAVLLVASVAARALLARPAVASGLQGLGIGLAALVGAGTLDDRFDAVPLAIVGGVLGAVCGFVAARAAGDLLGRVGKRLDAGAAAILPFYGEAFALLLVGLSVLFPPLALLGIGLLAFLLAGGRRREGEKYAGLRILR